MPQLALCHLWFPPPRLSVFTLLLRRVTSLVFNSDMGFELNMSTDEGPELRELVAQTLENNGVLSKIRVNKEPKLTRSHLGGCHWPARVKINAGGS